MHAYFRNHQLYLAEKCNWLDRQVGKSSKRALMKIESYKLILQAADDSEQIRLVTKLVKDSLLTDITNDDLLAKEGYFKYNLQN
jgi:peptidyl-tRNA hydrolase